MPFILDNWTRLVEHASWPGRYYHGCIVENGYIYLAGGQNHTPEFFADVYRSSNGENWSLLTDNPLWSGRSGHGFIYFLNKFWIFGGQTTAGGGYSRACYYSDDCINWTRGDDAPWPAMSRFGYCIHNNRLYVSGGFKSVFGNYSREVWSTGDMINWIQHSNTLLPDFNGYIWDHTMISFNGTLFIYGGRINDGTPDPFGFVSKRIYSSADNGVTWVYEKDAEWTERLLPPILICGDGNSIAVVGGVWGTDDEWESEDALIFTAIAFDNYFTTRELTRIVSLNKHAYIIGGYNTAGAISLNDVWESPAEPYAEFTGSPLSGIYPLTVNFTNESSGSPTSYLWDFGDGKTSTEENPTHRYDAPGVYTVTLSSTYSYGSYTETKENYITVTLDFTGTPRSGSRPLEVAFKL